MNRQEGIFPSENESVKKRKSIICICPKGGGFRGKVNASRK